MISIYELNAKWDSLIKKRQARIDLMRQKSLTVYVGPTFTGSEMDGYLFSFQTGPAEIVKHLDEQIKELENFFTDQGIRIE